MTEVRNDRFKEGDVIRLLRPDGRGITPTIRALDKLMPQATPEELREFRRELAIYILVNDDPDPEFRRELLKEFDTCPCCQGWLGHNRPPADAYSEPDYTRRQRSFDFER
jgi:hypothetical protein